jgi:hypothetical protein
MCIKKKRNKIFGMKTDVFFFLMRILIKAHFMNDGSQNCDEEYNSMMLESGVFEGGQ